MKIQKDNINEKYQSFSLIIDRRMSGFVEACQYV
jgi:hypothetical protein